ncbi:MAG TPA: phosphatase PAP2 family protein [Sphingomicrobium sp.]|nr:phosphatase PAP2 family protein [Sphingomicrobium sp.]
MLQRTNRIAPGATTRASRLAAFAGLAALWLAMLLLGAGDADKQVLLALYAADEPWLALAALGFTRLGDWSTVVGVTLAGALWLLWRRRRWHALTLLVASFTGRALVILQKAYFARLRPEEDLRLVEVHYQSFPSGHSANSMIVLLALALLLFDDARHRRIAVASAVSVSLLVGISRPMLGVHWPSDVLAGWAFGLFWVILVFAMMEQWKPGRSV